MAQLKRTEEREEVFFLLFENEFRTDETAEEIYESACAARAHESSAYMHDTYLGVCEKREAIDEVINANAKGWKVGRLSRVSRAVLRLGTYEVLFNDAIPDNVAMDEAVELSKRYGEEKSSAFVNGILNAVKNSKKVKKTAPEATAPAVEEAAPVTEEAAPATEETAPVTEEAAPVTEESAPEEKPTEGQN